MVVAILSDIHGNLPALEAALGALAAERVDQVVCLGDVAAFGPQPREALGRLREVGCPVVMGNTDAWLLDPQPHPPRDENSQRVTEIELWAAGQLTAEDQAYIRTFQATIELSLGEGASLLAFHGSPRSYNEVIRATTPDEELAAMLAGREATVLAGGHTHTPLVRRLGRALVINPGSVGLPWQESSPGQIINAAWAEFAVVRWEKGALGVSLRRVPYELGELVAAARASGMPHLEWWLKDWR
ncbi:MAG: metallophosphatase family protein [Chloroflexi bacterium]|nr:metallophosphatase family protein [Chloroflexota bacterium]MCI0574912.1 metallophosphatase family protein [Chloroflexota bacterium]MCI0647085.1 metallophosphatase family protein [Chloroflexota bacterium]MCI0727065.1 metallophosphatase family protein [Chloroflexota bacterium]